MEAAEDLVAVGSFGAAPLPQAPYQGVAASFALDTEGRIRRWSLEAERLLGWPAWQALGSPTALLVPPERADEHERLVRQCARHGRPERLLTQRLHKDGSRVDISLMLLPVHDAGGEPVGVLGRAYPAASLEARALDFERVVRQLTAMTDVALAVGGETSPERVLELIAERGRGLVDRRGLVVLRGQGSRLYVAAGGAPDLDLRGARLLCPDRVLDKLFSECDGPVHLGAGNQGLILRTKEVEVRPQQALLVPMLFADTNHGWLLAFDRREDQSGFSEEDAQLLRAYGSMAAASLATARSGEDERIRHSIEASESERAHLARELHDQTLQGLGGMRVLLALARDSNEPELMAGALDQAVASLGDEIEAVRRMTVDLRPAALDDLGLAAALDSLIERHRAAGRLRLETAISLDPAGAQEVSPASESTLYRLVQEALTNVVKHSEATRALVRVRRGRDSVAVEIEDDGRGFDPQGPRGEGFGLLGMRERATLAGGTFRLLSSPGSGTIVRATVPVRGNSPCGIQPQV